MRRFMAVLVLMALCAACLPGAIGETDYPPFQGIVADVAGVLGEATVTDLETFSKRMADAGLGNLYVLTRHFLGGAKAQAYANQVFKVWNLKDNDMLLLMVIGEESYALAAGNALKTALPDETRNTLLASSFRSAYVEERDYDGAVGKLALALGQSLAKSAGKTLNVSGLFGQKAVQSTPQPQSYSQILQGMFAQDEYTEDPWENEWQNEESHINWRGLIIWGLVIYFLFFRRKKASRRR